MITANLYDWFKKEGWTNLTSFGSDIAMYMKSGIHPRWSMQYTTIFVHVHYDVADIRFMDDRPTMLCVASADLPTILPKLLRGETV